MNLLSQAKSSIILCAPYIKQEITEKILINKNPDAELNVITSSNIASFLRKAIDIEAIELLIKSGTRVYNHQHLHAKVYWFDETNAIVTSSNLTYNGLNRNYEYSVLIQDRQLIESIRDDLHCLIEDELSGEFDEEDVDFIKEQIAFFKDNEYKITIDRNGDELLSPKEKHIIQSLQSWQKDVYEIIDTRMNDSFSLNELYEYENSLREIHPNNFNIRPKIRQVLQQLRDKGLIKFEEPGNYKKIIR